MNSNSTDIVIPLWEGTSEEEINISISSLKKEIELINNVIIVCDGENSFFKKLKETKAINHKILIIYIKKNMGPGIARNIGAIFSQADNLLFLDAGDICINNRIDSQINALKNNYVSTGAINERNSIGINRLKFSCKNFNRAKGFLPYKNPFNNVTIGIKRNFFNSIGGYGETRVGEDWILSGKILKETNKIDFKNEVLVLVNIKEDFFSRREGKLVYREIKKSLEKLYDLEIINFYQLIISKAIQKVSRVYLSWVFLKFIYKFNRKQFKL